MTIQLNPEEERLIGQAIQAGLIGKADGRGRCRRRGLFVGSFNRGPGPAELNTEQWLR